MARQLDRSMFENRPARTTPGAVLAPMADHRGAHGGWMERSGRAAGRPEHGFPWINLALFLLPIGLLSRLPAEIRARDRRAA